MQLEIKNGAWRERLHGDIMKAAMICFFATAGTAAYRTPASAAGTAFKSSNRALGSFTRSARNLGYLDSYNEPTVVGISFAKGILRNLGSLGRLDETEKAIFDRRPRFLKILQNFGSYDPGSQQ